MDFTFIAHFAHFCSIPKVKDYDCSTIFSSSIISCTIFNPSTISCTGIPILLQVLIPGPSPVAVQFQIWILVSKPIPGLNLVLISSPGGPM